MWFKKKSVLQGEGHYNSNTAIDGNDWRTTYSTNNRSWSVSQTLPSAADAGKYFYLPALGFYFSGKLDYAGSYGQYWSSSADWWNSTNAYRLSFYSGGINVATNNSRGGLRVDAFE